MWGKKRFEGNPTNTFRWGFGTGVPAPASREFENPEIFVVCNAACQARRLKRSSGAPQPKIPSPAQLEICRQTIFRLGTKLQKSGNFVQFLGGTAVVLSAAEWAFYRTLSKVPVPNPAGRSFGASLSIIATGAAMKAGGSALKASAGDQNAFKNAITAGTFEILSRGSGADEIFGIAVNEGAGSFLEQAEVKCE